MKGLRRLPLGRRMMTEEVMERSSWEASKEICVRNRVGGRISEVQL